MAVTELHLPADISGQDYRRLKGQANDLIASNVLNGKAIYADGAGSSSTDGSGDVDVDLTAQFSSIDVFFVQMQGTTAYTPIIASAPTAGHVQFRVFNAAGTAVLSTAVTYSWIAIGTPA